MTNLINTFNPESPAVKFHQVSTGDYFRGKVRIDNRPKAFGYNIPKWTVYKKISKSEAEVIATPNNGTRNDGKGYTERFAPATQIYLS